MFFSFRKSATWVALFSATLFYPRPIGTTGKVGEGGVGKGVEEEEGGLGLYTQSYIYIYIYEG